MLQKRQRSDRKKKYLPYVIPTSISMTLAILSSKIAAERDTPKVDGRCYNVRSQNKTKWEVFNLNKLQQKQARRAKRKGLVRGLCSREELAEYEQILQDERRAMVQARELKDAARLKDSDASKK